MLTESRRKYKLLEYSHCIKKQVAGLTCVTQSIPKSATCHCGAFENSSGGSGGPCGIQSKMIVQVPFVSV